MTKKKIVKPIILIIAGVVLLASAIIGSIYHYNDGTDFTDDYKVYNQVKDITTLSEARQTLQSLGMEYVIENQQLSLSDYSNIKFTINANDACAISDNIYMSGFKKLDDEDRSAVKITGVSTDGKISEKITYESFPFEFTKFNNHYYAFSHIVTIGYIISYVLSGFLIVFSIDDLILALKKS